MKWDGEYDTEEDKEKCEEQCQESFAVCNDEEVRLRLEKEENDTQDLCKQNDSYEVTWDGERDHEEDNKTDEDQRRESFDLRNAKGVRQRLEKENKDRNDLCKQHDNYELKLDGERDSEEDKKKGEDQRRESFDFRNAEGVRQRLEKEKKMDMIFANSMIAMS